jgi:hypothetical protein
VGTIRDSTGSLLPIGGPLTDGPQNPGDGGGNRSQEQEEEVFDPVDWDDENDSVRLESGEKKVQSEEEGDDENEDPEV